MKRILILLIGVCCSLSIYAQNKLSGVVSDESGMTIPGASVSVEGTSRGVVTNMDGKYSISVAKNETVVFRFMGYEVVKFKYSGEKKKDVELKTLDFQLDEVVAIGYGTSMKKDLTGAVAKLTPEDISKTATTNYDQALAGRIAGVQVAASDGTPGEALNIVIRGGNSITGDNSPLYVVDGIPLEDFDPASISSADIKSFDLLKDASATAIYGSRGANGVILITTNGGRSDGKTDIKISSSLGTQWIPSRLEVMGPYDYAKYLEQIAYARDGGKLGANVQLYLKSWVDPELYRDIEGTSWQDEIFRQASTQDYTLSISGGSKSTSLYYSGEYLTQEGTMINTGFNKILNNLKFTHKVNKDVTLNGQIQYSHYNRNGMNISGDSYTSVIRDAVQFRPVEPINSDGLEEGGYDPMDNNSKYLYNPVKNLSNTDRQKLSDVLRGTAGLKYNINKKFRLSLSGSYQIDNRRESVFYGADTQQGARGSDGINGTLTNRRYKTLSTSNTLTYTTKKGKNRYNVLAGMEAQLRANTYGSAKNTQIPTDAFGIDKLSLGIAPGIPTTSASESTMLSYFGRINYNFSDRYLLTANFRADGSSKFLPENRWGYFPSFSAAWRVKEESFLKDVEMISNLKVRGGWGVTGNNRIGDFAAYNLISAGKGYVWGDGESYTPGAFQSNLGVPDLKWETTSQINLGIDLGLLDQKIDIVFDLYQKRTSDLLLNAEMAPHTGFNTVQQNVGEVENKGIEFAINTVNIKNDNFTWRTSFNIAANRNKVISLNKGQDAIYTNPNWNFGYSEYQYISKVGESVGLMYGLQYDGLYQMDDFSWENQYQQFNLNEGIPDNGALPVAPGSVKFVDQNGDGTINSDDRVVIGSAEPAHFGGLSNDFTFKNFDLQLFFQWSYGFDILNANKAVFGVASAGSQNGFTELRDSWTPYNTDTDVGTILYGTVYGAAPKGNQIDSRYIEDGSYIKLKSVSLGYNLPKKILNRAGLKKVRFSVTGQNLYTWTSYSGYDPDVAVGKMGALTPSLDYSAYPQSVTVVGGINITL